MNPFSGIKICAPKRKCLQNLLRKVITNNRKYKNITIKSSQAPTISRMYIKEERIKEKKRYRNSTRRVLSLPIEKFHSNFPVLISDPYRNQLHTFITFEERTYDLELEKEKNEVDMSKNQIKKSKRVNQISVSSRTKYKSEREREETS